MLKQSLTLVVLFSIILESLNTQNEELNKSSENSTNDIPEMNYQEIRKSINEIQDLLVFFHMEHCNYCKELTKTLLSLEENIKSKLIKTDVLNDNRMETKFGVKSVPTLILFTKRKGIQYNITYNGNRTLENLTDWFKLKTTQDLIEIQSKQQLYELQYGDSICIVLFSQNRNQQAIQTFTNIMLSYDNIKFAVSDDSELIKSQKLSTDSIVLYKQYDNLRDVYDGNLQNETQIKKFIKEKSQRIVMEFNQEAAEVVFGGGHDAVILFRNSKKHKALDSILKEVAPNIKDKVKIVTCDLKSSMNIEFAQFLGVSKEDLPMVKLVSVKEDYVRKYTLRGEITSDNLMSFVSQFELGLLKHDLKSEEIPPENPDDPTKNLVGKNFEKIAYDETKDVLVAFYTPWDGNSQRLAPIYQTLAATLDDVDNLIFAKINSDDNEVEDFYISVVPTIYFFPANNKKGILYEGDVTQKALLNFLKEHASASEIEDVELSLTKAELEMEKEEAEKSKKSEL